MKCAHIHACSDRTHADSHAFCNSYRVKPINLPELGIPRHAFLPCSPVLENAAEKKIENAKRQTRQANISPLREYSASSSAIPVSGTNSPDSIPETCLILDCLWLSTSWHAASGWPARCTASDWQLRGESRRACTCRHRRRHCRLRPRSCRQYDP